MAYATQQDLFNVGFPQTAIGPLTPTQINAALQDASDELDTYFRGRYGDGPSPLLATWDSQVTCSVAKIAAYRLMRIRGFDPANGADDMFVKDRDEAILWCRDVQRQQAHPVVTVNSAAALKGSAQPIITTSSCVAVATGQRGRMRGW